jgi:hypothetical protein
VAGERVAKQKSDMDAATSKLGDLIDLLAQQKFGPSTQIGLTTSSLSGSVRISVCEASFSRTHNWVFDCKRWRIVAARLRHLLGLFLGSIKAPVPSSRPGIIPATARWPCQIRRLRRDRSHAQPPLGGEPGEDPRFATARRGAMLRPGHRGAPISHGHSQAVAGPWRWCPNRDRSSPEAPPP